MASNTPDPTLRHRSYSNGLNTVNYSKYRDSRRSAGNFLICDVSHWLDARFHRVDRRSAVLRNRIKHRRRSAHVASFPMGPITSIRFLFSDFYVIDGPANLVLSASYVHEVHSWLRPINIEAYPRIPASEWTRRFQSCNWPHSRCMFFIDCVFWLPAFNANFLQYYCSSARSDS